MKTRDLILSELKKIDKIPLKDLADRINKKVDAVSHQVKNLSNEGLVRSERVRLGRSYNTFVWLSKNNIQLEKDKIQVEGFEESGDIGYPEKDMDKNLFRDLDQKTFQVDSKKNRRILENSKIQVEKLKLSTTKLRGMYEDLTFSLKTGKGSSHRGSRNECIDLIIEELLEQKDKSYVII